MAISNLSKRLLSASVIVPPVLALIFWGPSWLFATVLGLFAAQGAYEFGEMSTPEASLSTKLLFPLFALAVYAAVLLGSATPSLLIAAGALVPLLAVFYLNKKEDLSTLVTAFSHTVAGALYAGGLLAFMGLIFTSVPAGRYWVFLLLTATIFSDTLAYTFGRLFGKHKLAPRISPNKTWEGAFGGVCGSILAVAIAKLVFFANLSWFDAVSFGAVLSAFCQFGDLTESFLKRGFKVKDSGKIIPGHGGILDRCDALMFGAPVVYFYAVLRFG